MFSLRLIYDKITLREYLIKSSPYIENNIKVIYLINKKEKLKVHIIKCYIDYNVTVK